MEATTSFYALLETIQDTLPPVSALKVCLELRESKLDSLDESERALLNLKIKLLFFPVGDENEEMT